MLYGDASVRGEFESDTQFTCCCLNDVSVRNHLQPNPAYMRAFAMKPVLAVSPPDICDIVKLICREHLSSYRLLFRNCFAILTTTLLADWNVRDFKKHSKPTPVLNASSAQCLPSYVSRWTMEHPPSPFCLKPAPVGAWRQALPWSGRQLEEA